MAANWGGIVSVLMQVSRVHGGRPSSRLRRWLDGCEVISMDKEVDSKACGHLCRSTKLRVILIGIPEYINSPQYWFDLDLLSNVSPPSLN